MKESSENNANYVTLTGQVDNISGLMPEIIVAAINEQNQFPERKI